MADLNLVVKLLSDTRDLNKGVKGINSTLQKWQSTALRLGAGLGLAFGAREVTDYLGQAVNMASDLEEAQNKVNAVFDDSAFEVLQWASTLSSAYGISERQATQAAGTYGQVAQAMGLTNQEAAELSPRLVELAGDLASFANVDTVRSLEAIRAGLTGENEALKSLGVVINETILRETALREGITETNRVLSTREKALAFQATIFEQTADAQGDAERTADTYAGTVRQLQAELENVQTEIGAALLPAMLQLNQAFLDGVRAVQDWAAAIGQAAGALPSVPNRLREVNEEFGVTEGLIDVLTVQFGEELAPVLAQVATAVGLVENRLPSFGAGWASITNEMDRTAASAGGAAAGFTEIGDAAAGAGQQLASWSGAVEVPAPTQFLNSIIESLLKAEEEVNKSPGRITKKVARINRIFERLSKKLNTDLTAEQGPAAEAMGQYLGGVLNKVNEQIEPFNTAFGDLGTAAKTGTLEEADISTLEWRQTLFPNYLSALSMGASFGSVIGQGVVAGINQQLRSASYAFGSVQEQGSAAVSGGGQTVNVYTYSAAGVEDAVAAASQGHAARNGGTSPVRGW